MRRRTWALIRMSDVMFSHQVSLPHMIYDHDCDTQLPTNIFDDEFYPGIKELPPPRPITEPTPIAYMIVKARLCNEAGNVLAATNRLGTHIPYDEILRFDAKLRQLKQELPPHLRLVPLESSRDPVTLMIARFNIDVLYLKILCLLHRKYIPRAWQNSRYAHSRRSAIEASMQALDHLAVLHRESQPNGRLRSLGWYIKSIATRDFGLAATLLVLELHLDNVAQQQDSPSSDTEAACIYTTAERNSMISKLETARDIWADLADSSMEAVKGYKVIDVMLAKIKEPSTDPPVLLKDDLMATETLNPAVTMAQPSVPQPSMGDFGPGMDAFSAANNNSFMGMDFGLTPGAPAAFQPEGLSASAAGPSMSMFNMGSNAASGPDLAANFDWVSTHA